MCCTPDDDNRTARVVQKRLGLLRLSSRQQVCKHGMVLNIIMNYVRNILPQVGAEWAAAG